MTLHKVNQPVTFTAPVIMPGGGGSDANGNQTVGGNQNVNGNKTVNGTTTHKGKVVNESPVELSTYTVAGVPSAATNAGSVIYVSNGAAGLPIVAFSDGTSWLRVDTRTPVAAA